MIEAVLAVDIGTTSLKAGLVTAEGEVVSFYKSTFSAPQNRFIAEAWFWSLKACVDKLDKSKVSILAVSISGNGPTLVSESGLTLRWNEGIAKNTVNDDGIDSPTKSLFIPKIELFKNIFPEEYDSSVYLYSGPEYLIKKITGNAVTVLPEARFMEAYWTAEELAKYKLSQDKMPDYVGIGEKCGDLTQEVADFLGLPANIPVFSGGPDFVAALIGTNTLSAGKLCDRSGSSEGINFCCDKQIFAEGLRTLPSVIPGLWNISALLTKSSTLSEEERLDVVAASVNRLKTVLEENNISFPKEMIVTGGQTQDKEYMKLKSEKLGLELKVGRCSDSELIGDACAAWFGLGKYASLIEAAAKLV